MNEVNIDGFASIVTHFVFHHVDACLQRGTLALTNFSPPLIS